MRVRGSSSNRPAAWLASALGLALYAAAAFALLALDPHASLPGPGWMSLAVPPIVYALFCLMGLRRLSLRQTLVALGALCGLHLLLALATVLLFFITAPPVSAPWRWPALTLLPLVGTLLITAPYHPVLEGRSLRARRDVRPAPRPDPHSTLPPGAPAPSKTPPSEAPPTPRPAPPPERAARPPAAERGEEMIRIPFARVAEQLPLEAFLLARDRVAANLLEAGYLLVPRRLVLPQLGEGLVRVGWAVVADQFPRQALALSGDEIARQIPNGALVLPLDEIVRQMPPELFVVSAPTIDVSGIEDFPPPFQPHVPPPSATTEEPALEAPIAEPATDRPAPADPVAVGTATAPGVETGSAEVGSPSGSVAMEEGQTLEAQRIAAELGPLMSPLEVTARPRGGPMLFTVVSPGLSVDAVADTATRVLPFLSDPRLPAPVTQATLRGTAAAVVLTSLVAADAGGPVLVTAVGSDAPLALLERLSLRAAGEGRGPEGRARSGRRGVADQPGEPGASGDLQEATVPMDVRALADSLQAFGSVRPTVLRDPAETWLVYLFLGPGLPALPIGHFARDLHGALAAAEIGSVTSVTLQLPTRRVVVRALETTVRCTTLLVAGGGTPDRPGLARLELDRAAMRLRGAARG